MEELTSRQRKAEYMKAWRAANREKVRESFQKWKEANKEARAAYQKQYHGEYRKREGVQKTLWERNLRNNYQLAPEAFNALWEQQGGKCGVCSTPMAPRGRTSDSVCVDHNHLTGEVRGLLCRGCNHGIGQLKDCPDVLEAAAKYLRSKGNYSTSPYLKEVEVQS